MPVVSLTDCQTLPLGEPKYSVGTKTKILPSLVLTLTLLKAKLVAGLSPSAVLKNLTLSATILVLLQVPTASSAPWQMVETFIFSRKVTIIPVFLGTSVCPGAG